tara:strand:- start:898 stop:1281 length:384 start_codon:yes stop_codon:yes gene_type:complete
MSDKSLRNKVIRLAHSKPELRSQLLPLLTKKGAGNEASELKNIFKQLQRQFGSAQRWDQAGFEAQYMIISDGKLRVTYTTGLRGEDLDNYDLVYNHREHNYKQVVKHLKKYNLDISFEDEDIIISLK